MIRDNSMQSSEVVIEANRMFDAAHALAKELARERAMEEAAAVLEIVKTLLHEELGLRQCRACDRWQSRHRYERELDQCIVCTRVAEEESRREVVSLTQYRNAKQTKSGL